MTSVDETEIARLTRERDEARWAATCDVCLGDPLPGTRGCICGGTGKLADTALGLREELARADNRAVAAEKERDEAREERDRARRDHGGACHLVAKMHHAATGAVTGPARGVVEDVAGVRARLLAAESRAERLAEALRHAGSPYADPLDTQTCPRCSGHGVVPLEVTAADLRRRLLAVAAFCRHETMCNQVVYGEPCTCGLDALLTLPRVRAAERKERGKEKEREAHIAEISTRETLNDD